MGERRGRGEVSDVRVGGALMETFTSCGEIIAFVWTLIITEQLHIIMRVYNICNNTKCFECLLVCIVDVIFCT